jgi:chemosensory pili system protein ChpA (sensor histidine kinase/response regulator)
MSARTIISRGTSARVPSSSDQGEGEIAETPWRPRIVARESPFDAPPSPLILVIDDSLSVYASVKRALSLDGYINVERLDCFIDLPRKIRDRPPALILLDLNIPELPGLTMGHYIRKHQARRIPIIIYSSSPLAELERAAAELAASAIVQKSSSGEELRTQVKKALQNG